jgi:hypothetical protein
VKVKFVAWLIAWQAVTPVPEAVRRELDSTCPAWTIAAVIPEVDADIRARTPQWPANFISGDFDQDGRADIALLVECGSTVELSVFLAGPAGYTRHLIEKPQPIDRREFLYLIRKGAADGYDRDAVGVEYEALGGHAWLFRDGRWQSVAR